MQRSSIQARPRVTPKASARACVLFRPRNGGEIKHGPRSKTSGQENRKGLAIDDRVTEQARAQREASLLFRVHSSAGRIALALCLCGLGERPRRFGSPILLQLFALLEHESLGLVEVRVNARAQDGVTGNTAGYQVARILLSLASPRN